MLIIYFFAPASHSRLEECPGNLEGFFFEGPPGCCKALTAVALSNIARLKGPEILSKFPGESER